MNQLYIIVITKGGYKIFGKGAQCCDLSSNERHFLGTERFLMADFDNSTSNTLISDTTEAYFINNRSEVGKVG